MQAERKRERKKAGKIYIYMYQFLGYVPHDSIHHLLLSNTSKREFEPSLHIH